MYKGIVDEDLPGYMYSDSNSVTFHYLLHYITFLINYILILQSILDLMNSLDQRKYEAIQLTFKQV